MNKKAVFLAHWVEPWNVLLLWFPFLNSRPELRWVFFWLWPVCWAVSLLWLFGKRSHDVVDDFEVCDPVDPGCGYGRIALIRAFGWHFFIPSRRDQIRDKILRAVLVLQGGASVIGLGALNKDKKVSDGGALIVKELGDRLRVPIVHGDTLTAAVVIKQVLALIEKYQIATPVFLTGSTSKIGRATAIKLAQLGIRVLMYTQDRDRFEAIAKEAGDEASKFLQWSPLLSDGLGCSLWVTGKAVPAGSDLYRYIPRGGVVLNFAVPNPLNQWDARCRRDLILVSGGLLAYDPKQINIHFSMRLPRGLTYACHAGTIVHSLEGWSHHEVGPVDINKLDEVWEASRRAGFKLPEI